jgi:hypothetical protein
VDFSEFPKFWRFPMISTVFQANLPREKADLSWENTNHPSKTVINLSKINVNPR